MAKRDRAWYLAYPLSSPLTMPAPPRAGLLARLREGIASLEPALVEIRHDLHQHPELGFEEHRTQKLVRNWLERWGYITTAAAETGLVADLQPGHPGPTIALRADLDCLPMDELTPLPYRSVHAGRAHKCGHDGHTTILMGVAALLAGVRGELPGNVRLVFQPAEEGARGGGAKVMVEEGVLRGVHEVYGLHNWPGYPYGQIRVRAGAIMAQTHALHLNITGVGGHGSQPQICRDPIVAGAHLVTALQTVVSRGLGYEGGAVVSICQFQAGNTTNVIPGHARLAGTIRTFAPEVGRTVLARVHEIARGIAQSFGVEIEVEIDHGYPVLINHPECTAAVERVAEAIVGADNVSDLGLPMAGGEDFAYLTQACPGAYFFVGTGRDGQITPGCHHPDFDFDDSILPVAIQMMLGLVEDRLYAKASSAVA